MSKDVKRIVRAIHQGKLELPKGDPGVMRVSAPLPVQPRWLSDFGKRQVQGAGDFHTGVDLAAPLGTPVAAVTGGRVLVAGEDPLAGIHCVIQDAGGRQWAYAHMSAYNVVPGARVKPGQVIGAVGHSGVATGNHLHIGVKIKGEWANPVATIQRAFGAGWGKTKRHTVASTDFDAPDFGGARVGERNGAETSPITGQSSVAHAWQDIVNSGPVSPETERLASRAGAVPPEVASSA